MTSIDSRLAYLERELRKRIRDRPPDPTLAALQERLCIAMTLAHIECAHCADDDPPDTTGAKLQAMFFTKAAMLGLIIADVVRASLWQYAVRISALARQQPDFLRSLHVSFERRSRDIQISSGKSASSVSFEMLPAKPKMW